jgi:hypothetical protein
MNPHQLLDRQFTILIDITPVAVVEVSEKEYSIRKFYVEGHDERVNFSEKVIFMREPDLWGHLGDYMKSLFSNEFFARYMRGKIDVFELGDV